MIIKEGNEAAFAKASAGKAKRQRGPLSPRLQRARHKGKGGQSNYNCFRGFALGLSAFRLQFAASSLGLQLYSYLKSKCFKNSSL
jgi:hypothetical protein